MNEEVIFGRKPEIGDKVYIDFGDGVDGGEVTGTLNHIYSEQMWIIDGIPYDLSTASHIEVVEGS